MAQCDRSQWWPSKAQVDTAHIFCQCFPHKHSGKAIRHGKTLYWYTDIPGQGCLFAKRSSCPSIIMFVNMPTALDELL